MAQHLSGPAEPHGPSGVDHRRLGRYGPRDRQCVQGRRRRVVATDLGEHEDIGPGIEYRRYDVTSRAQTDQVIDERAG